MVRIAVKQSGYGSVHVVDVGMWHIQRKIMGSDIELAVATLNCSSLVLGLGLTTQVEKTDIYLSTLWMWFVFRISLL